MSRPPCLCDGRADIRCDNDHCDLAHPTGAPGDADKCVVCHLFHNSPAHRALWGGAPAALPCVHLGPETGERRDCKTCGGAKGVPLRSCAVHGECTSEWLITGLAWCRTCREREPDAHRLVRPQQGDWEGSQPWNYRVTAIIPHLETVEPLKMAVALLRAQTVRPYVVVIDTGSKPATLDQLEHLRAADVEIHHVRAHGYMNSSGAVTTALDLGFALCRTEYAYNTHTDVFPKRRDWLEWLLSRCGAAVPVVGYEMSERSWATDQWRGLPSHTATMYHVPTVRRHGLTWSMERAYELAGWVGQAANGWPDTETGFGLLLKRLNIPIELLGPETNYKYHEDDNIVHVRTYTGGLVYAGTDNPDMARALAAARLRLAQWR